MTGFGIVMSGFCVAAVLLILGASPSKVSSTSASARLSAILTSAV
jgi:hypothetical protein